MVGGAAVTEKWAEDIGADAYAENASDAVKAAQGLVARR
jgi:trimethylamine corrinoid protein